ncbi:sulfite exporter TauE/SafE family protein [Parahaliea sp. F7430]|uniref:Sulfite exporter TauE/SafE family protein n=1 Tax=Sediminihaliea albiluteola TaxID=2758564 RepID=A0A7W2YIZ2_9GAMM|nr:sulfite exporter TauE/SafE family protein [Sediminihaliea albiluteola]MBA6412567.1 sulfite exporter TauE/SafE family protein [Sediminihaliea albiluteola]
MDSALLAAFLVGIAGAGHCLGMCGGIAAALSLSGVNTKRLTLAYHAGRLSSYSLLGAALGFAASGIDIAAWTITLRYLAAVLLIAMGLYIADWWRGLQWLERAGAHLWKPIQGLAKNWIPVRNMRQALALGLCWGMMPCGLIYSALALAATRQEPLGSGLMMLAFGIGTLPAMLSSSLGAAKLQQLLRRRGLKQVIAALLVISGAWTLYITASHSDHLLQQTQADQTSSGHHSHH